MDWYGRIVGNEWIENRKKHNKRICYEFARFYAKAINELIKEDNALEMEAFMLGDKDNLHYVVGLAGKEYSVILDLDDFNSIKDLTRLKIGLTIKGIHILRDENNKFKKALDNFNKGRFVELKEIEDAKEQLREKNIIEYFKKVIEILNSHNIDSQGFFEYVRSIVEESNIKIEKIWKEDTNSLEKRYERCLYFDFGSKTYLLDSISKTLTIEDIQKLNEKIYIFNSEENQYSYYGA